MGIGGLRRSRGALGLVAPLLGLALSLGNAQAGDGGGALMARAGRALDRVEHAEVAAGAWRECARLTGPGRPACEPR
jgi:hypothetical protein